jgi:solute carrier family 35 protein C2
MLVGVVLVISIGLLLLVEGETSFDGRGFALVMGASCMSGFRFTVTQIFLQGHEAAGKVLEASWDLPHICLLHWRAYASKCTLMPVRCDMLDPKTVSLGGPLEVVEVLTPVMTATVLLLSLVWEHPWVSLPASPYFGTWAGAAGIALLPQLSPDRLKLPSVLLRI